MKGQGALDGVHSSNDAVMYLEGWRSSPGRPGLAWPFYTCMYCYVILLLIVTKLRANSETEFLYEGGGKSVTPDCRYC